MPAQQVGQDLQWTAHQTPVQWLPRLQCQQCDYYTNTQNELMYHVELRHQQERMKCDKCPQTFESSALLVGHIVQQHTRNPQRQRNTLDNGVWKCFYCNITFSGDEERDSHICSNQPYQTVQQQRRRHNKRNEKCTRGPECHFRKLGTCHYSHAHDVEINSYAQENTRDTRKNNMWCAFQDKCTRRQTCQYKHMDEERDFVQNLFRGRGL